MDHVIASRDALFGPDAMQPGAFGVDDVACSLWGWPDLLGWPVPFAWLFTFPPISKSVGGGWPGPGQLWGVDQDGQLILVNIQVAGSGQGLDPFGVFTSPRAPGRLYTRDAIRTERGLSLNSDLIRHRWGDALQRELRVLCHPSRSGMGSDYIDLNRVHILPHESHGPAARRWTSAGLLRPEEQLGGPGYRSLVEEGLDALARQSRPQIHAVGVVASRGNSAVRLSSLGRENYELLYASMRPSYVHSRVVAVDWTSLGITIRSRLPQHTEWCSASPSTTAGGFIDENRARPFTEDA